MTPLSPLLLIATAGAFVGTGVESETSRGRLLDLMFTRVGQPNHGPWSPAFVHYAGYWSHYDVRGEYSSWPLPATNAPRDLVAFGEERRICLPEPERGDVFLLWSPSRKEHTRAGIIAEVEDRLMYPRTRRPYWVCRTIEGDTTEHGAMTGNGIHLVYRKLSSGNGDRFLRWTALDARAAMADPAAETEREAGRIVLRRAS